MSKDVVTLCINNIDKFDYNIIDDVSIGLFMEKMDVKQSEYNFGRFDYIRKTNSPKIF